MNKNVGFTLIELLVGIAVLAVALSIAVPNFQSVLGNARQVTFYNKMSSTLRFARSEAIKRSTGVTVCARATDMTCGSDWSNGMLVFVDSTRTGDPLIYDTGDETIRAVKLPGPGITMKAKALLEGGTAATSTTLIRFNGRGQPNWVNGTLSLCDSRGSTFARALVMTGSGVSRKAYRTASSNGVVVDASGNAVSCA